MEWRLFEEGTVPEFTTPEFFEAHPWIWPGHQVGHAERLAMVAQLVRDIKPWSVVDLGCGDGSLLAELPEFDRWGYDAGTANVAHAQWLGLDVVQADFLTDRIRYADLIVCSEVVEHLVDPHGFIAGLPGRQLVLSSPSAESDAWHYEHHTWAWDLLGYREMVEAAGWTVQAQRECTGPPYDHGTNFWQPIRFQAIYATRSA